MRRAWLALVAACGYATCHAGQECASNIASLRALVADESFALEWRETTMGGGKPLVLSVLERDGILFLAFVKTGQGLWAEGAGVVCRNGSQLEATLAPERLRVGPAAHWAVRYAFGNGALFTLSRIGADKLRVETAGWSGVFGSSRPRS